MSIDVRVLGAGVAGAAAAARLASFGRSVECLVRGTAGARPPEETVVQTARPLLDGFGLAEHAARHWPGSKRHGVIWGSEEVRWRDHTTEAPGYKIVRAEFDEAVRAEATRLGARFHEAPPNRIPATLTIHATGKSPAGAPPDQRIVDTLPETVALWTFVEPARSGRDTAAWSDATVIEAVPEGWWWWLPIAGGRATLALLCDGAELKTRGRDAIWGRARAAAHGPASTANVSPGAAVVATPRRRQSDHSLLIGDAASSIDPLSSQGVEKALSSADEASLVANTILHSPTQTSELLVHHRAWERALFDAHALRGLRWYAGEARFTGAPFWSARAQALQDREPPDPGPLPERFVPSPTLTSATVWRRGDEILHPSPGFRLEEGMALDRIGDVPLPPLMPLLAGGATLKDVIQRARGCPDFYLLSAGRIDGAITELWRRGFLVGE